MLAARQRVTPEKPAWCKTNGTNEMKTALKLARMIERMHRLSAGEKRPSRRAKMRKMAMKPANAAR
jgi:hypothetical protein